MKFFQNKKIKRNLIIVFLLVMLFQFVFVKPVQASVLSVALDPITGLFSRLGDGIMEILQKTFLGMDTSGAWVEEKSNVWLNILIAVVAIAVAVIAIAATIASGGAALTIILAAAGAVIKIGAGAAVAFYAVNTLHLGSSGFYLPEYQLNPGAIFKNEIIAFDVNFFNPKKPKKEVIKVLDEPDFNEPLISNDEKITFGENTYRVFFNQAVGEIERNGENIFTSSSAESSNTNAYYMDIYNALIGFIEADLNKSKPGNSSNTKEKVEQEYKECFYEEFDSLLAEVNEKWDFTYRERYAFDDNVFIELIYNPTAISTVVTVNVSEKYSGEWKKILDQEEVKVNEDGRDYAYESSVGAVVSAVMTNSSDTEETAEYIKLSDEEKNRIAVMIFENKKEANTYATDLKSPAEELQSAIASWYLVLRNIALVALLSILVYIGIRITLTSVAGDKAKYKQMLVDWVVALALVFLMHYIMAFAVTINEKIIEAIASIGPASAGTVTDFIKKEDKIAEYETEPSLEADQLDTEKKEYQNDNDIDGQAVQLFRIVDGAEKAYKVLIGDDNDKDKKSGDYSRYKNRFHEENDEKVLYWPAYDYMTQARMLGQGIVSDNLEEGKDASNDDNKDQEAVMKSGYKIIYVVLVIYTVIFCLTYLKRVIYMAFLTIIAPLVAITYPIDKISDGKAQAFNMWLREYIFNLLIQPMHLILYTILVTSAIKFAAHNIFYVVVAMGFLVPAEKMLRGFFGFEKAKTPGVFGGAAGAALMMSGMNKLMSKGESSKNNSGGDSENNGENDENSDIRMSSYNNGEDPLDNFVLGLGGASTPTLNNNISGGDTTFNDNTEYSIDNSNQEQNENRNSSVSFENTQNGQMELNVKGNSLKRAIKRGMISYGNGMKKRYTMNKKRNGGIFKRGLRLAGGVATATTMAAAGGIIGIASGDFSKAAKYAATGAIGGYNLGKTGVNKTIGKIEEQYKEPIKEAKKGFYGEEGYKQKQHEKWKKENFKKNAENILKIQDAFNVNEDQAKKLSEEISKYTDYKGIDSFEDALAVKKLQEKQYGGYSEKEALLIANLQNNHLGGRLDKMNRKEREGKKADLKERIASRMQGVEEEKIDKTVDNLLQGTIKFSTFKEKISNAKIEQSSSGNQANK